MDTLPKFLAPIIGFLVTVAFGFWLSKVGKPYNGILFNIHKLIALGTVIFASVQIYNSLKVMGSRPLLIGSLAIAAVCLLALFVSGALLSIGNARYETFRLIHNVRFVLVVLAMGSVIYLLTGGTS